MKTAERIMTALSQNLENIKQFDPSEVQRFISQANEDYFNGDGSVKIPDDIYDHVKKYLSAVQPDANVLAQVGHEVPKDKKKVDLPIYMGSLKKIKTAEEIKKWKDKFPAVSFAVSDKLDGVSGLYMVKKGTKPTLYTRGNGRVGEDVSFLLEYIDNIKFDANAQDIVVRGEIVMSKTDFESLDDEFKNARNLVAGAVNSVKTRRLEVIRKLRFVAYELVTKDTCLPPMSQYSLLKNLGFDVVEHMCISELTKEALSNMLVARRANGTFVVDGLAVVANAEYKRAVDENPSYAMAFKDVATQDHAETLVTAVTWEVSKDGLYKPTVVFEPVELAGATIAKATGFNAKFIKENVIGPGARIVVVRSGDVIPFIKQVVSPASQPSFPANQDYVWNGTGVDIVATSVSDDMHIKLLTFFFAKLDTKGVSEKTITTMYKFGFKTVGKVAKMTVQDLMMLPGFKDKSAANVVASIKKALEEATPSTIMAASNAFGRGFGERKLDLLMKEIPDLHKLDRWDNVTVEMVANVDGFAKKTASQFVDSLNHLKTFVRDNGLDHKF